MTPIFNQTICSHLDCAAQKVAPVLEGRTAPASDVVAGTLYVHADCELRLRG